MLRSGSRVTSVTGTSAVFLFFSCGGRKLVLGLKTPQEVQTLRGALPKDIPICGLYVYGEIAPIDSTDPNLNQVRFHNTTLVLCAL